MSDVAASNPAPAVAPAELRTMHCVQCDYSLEGLPRDAKCPECGTAIDDRFLVIRGRNPYGPYSWVAGIPYFFAPLTSNWAERFLFGRPLSNWGDALFVVIWINMWSPWLLAALWNRWHLNGTSHQLWVCDEGFWVRSRADPFANRWTRWVINVVGVLAGTVLVAFAFSFNGVAGVIATFFVGLSIAIGLLMRHEFVRETTIIHIDGVGPQRCIPWRLALSTAVEHVKDEKYRVVIKPRPPAHMNLHRRGVDAFTAELAEFDAAALRTRLMRTRRERGD